MATPTVLGVESEAIHPEKVKSQRQEIDITIRILVTITKKVTGKHRWRSLREAHTPNTELRLPVKKQTRPPLWTKREILDGIFYQLKNGCNWED